MQNYSKVSIIYNTIGVNKYLITISNKCEGPPIQNRIHERSSQMLAIMRQAYILTGNPSSCISMLDRQLILIYFLS